jgi:hypothetical protein
MRLETAHEQEHVASLEFLYFAAAGLLSGLLSWWLVATGNVPGFLTITVKSGVQNVPVNITPSLLFATCLAAAFFLTGAAARLNSNPVNWVVAYLATVAIYFLIVAYLFAGYFSQLFRMPGWLNFGLCGLIGAGLMALITGTLTGKVNNGVMLAMCVAGALCAFSGFSPLFLWPWWQFSVGTLIGLWVQSSEE